MKTLLIVFLTFLSSCLLNTLALADTCYDYRQKTGLDLNEAECYVLNKVEKGERADLKERFLGNKHWPLRANFIESLLTGSLLNMRVAENGIRISNAHINQAMNLEDIRLIYPTIFFKCTFYDDVNFTKVHFNKEISFVESSFLAKANFAYTSFSKKANFGRVVFSSDANFFDTKFNSIADFEESKFLGIVNFGKTNLNGMAVFRKSKFSGTTDFSMAEFKEKTNFSEAFFSGEAYFSKVIFSKQTYFSQAMFSNKADFSWSAFDEVSFQEAKFLESTQFQGATFSNAYFYKVTFQKDTLFWGNKFSKANFGESIFDGKTYFVECLFPTKISFRNVTGFSQMLMEWEYDSQWNRSAITKSKSDRKYRGIKGHLEYNETFFIALIKNYRDMGWFREADDCYYTYRVEKRKHLLHRPNESGGDDKKESTFTSKFWKNLILYGEYLLLDFTFGYGVKPLKILRTFLILWIAFSFYYVGFLRSKYGEKLPWWRAWNPIYKPSRFAWSLLYSLDKLTPAIKLDSLKSLNPNVFIKQNSKRVIYVERLQNLLGWYWFALFLILFSRVWIR